MMETQEVLNGGLLRLMSTTGGVKLRSFTNLECSTAWFALSGGRRVEVSLDDSGL